MDTQQTEIKNQPEIARYYGETTDLSPIATNVVDQKTLGALSAKSPNLPNEVSISLIANKSRPEMYLHYITKTQQGTFKLNTMFPLATINLPRQGSTNLDTVNEFVSVAAHSGYYRRNIGTEASPKYVGVYPDGNIGDVTRLFSSSKLIALFGFANLSTGLIPANVNYCQGLYRTDIPGDNLPAQFNGATIGQVINQRTLSVWNRLRMLQNAEETENSELTKEDEILSVWKRYQQLLQLWQNEGYITESTVRYAIENSLEPYNAAKLGYGNTSKELNIQEIIGTAYGMRSFLPKVNRAYMMGIITDSVTDVSGKFQYGVFKMNTKANEGLVTLTDEKEISETMEQCTREVQITDGAGRPVYITVRVVDTSTNSTFTDGEGRSKRNITKRSRIFAELPVGTQVLIQGGRLIPHYCQTGTQAVRFTVDDFQQKVLNASNNMIIGDTTSEVLEESQMKFQAEFVEEDFTFQEELMEHLVALQPDLKDQEPVVQSTAKDDNHM